MSKLVALPRPALVHRISKPMDDEIVFVVTGVADRSDPYVKPIRHITITRDRNERRFTLFVAGERITSSKVMRRLRRTASELECAYIVQAEDIRLAAVMSDDDDKHAVEADAYFAALDYAFDCVGPRIAESREPLPAARVIRRPWWRRLIDLARSASAESGAK